MGAAGDAKGPDAGEMGAPFVQINEEEIGKLPEKELRIMIVKMIKNLEN